MINNGKVKNGEIFAQFAKVAVVMEISNYR
jgi:hypothetical protein